jgi:hypothetical protein
MVFLLGMMLHATYFFIVKGSLFFILVHLQQPLSKSSILGSYKYYPNLQNRHAFCFAQ